MIKVNLSKKKNNNPIDTVVLDLNNFIYLPKPPPPSPIANHVLISTPTIKIFLPHWLQKMDIYKKKHQKNPKPGIDLSNRISNKSYR